jgi:hypothetical protein
MKKLLLPVGPLLMILWVNLIDQFHSQMPEPTLNAITIAIHFKISYFFQ